MLLDLCEYPVPLLDEDLEVAQDPPENVVTLRTVMVEPVPRVWRAASSAVLGTIGRHRHAPAALGCVPIRTYRLDRIVVCRLL